MRPFLEREGIRSCLGGEKIGVVLKCFFFFLFLPFLGVCLFLRGNVDGDFDIMGRQYRKLFGCSEYIRLCHKTEKQLVILIHG